MTFKRIGLLAVSATLLTHANPTLAQTVRAPEARQEDAARAERTGACPRDFINELFGVPRQDCGAAPPVYSDNRQPFEPRASTTISGFERDLSLQQRPNRAHDMNRAALQLWLQRPFLLLSNVILLL